MLKVFLLLLFKTRVQLKRISFIENMRIKDILCALNQYKISENQFKILYFLKVLKMSTR